MKKTALTLFGLCCLSFFSQAQFTSPAPGVQHTPDDVGIGTITPSDAIDIQSTSTAALRVGYNSGGTDYYSRLQSDGMKWYNKQAGFSSQNVASINVDLQDGDFLLSSMGDISMSTDRYTFKSENGLDNLKLNFLSGYAKLSVPGQKIEFGSTTENAYLRFDMSYNVFKIMAGDVGDQIDLDMRATDDIALRAEEHITLESNTGKVILEDLTFGGDQNNDAMFITGDGRVGMGVTNVDPDDMPAGYRLYVTEGILAERVKVALSTATEWSDYVFDDDYELMSLKEVSEYVSKKHHLPNVPSADEVVEQGIDVAKMDALLLEKIEELTLYIIDLQKQINELKLR